MIRYVKSERHTKVSVYVMFMNVRSKVSVCKFQITQNTSISLESKTVCFLPNFKFYFLVV